VPILHRLCRRAPGRRSPCPEAEHGRRRSRSSPVSTAGFLVTTSLLGNGGTAERRSPANPSIDLQADALEQVTRRAGGPVHVVTHSYGGVGMLALALRGSVEIASLTLIEPNPADVLRQAGELELYRRFRTMSDA
jgi:pimeloyl-ACP methyl ester carboxylesterase